MGQVALRAGGVLQVLAAALILTFASVAPAWSEKRVALVIGNAAYRDAPLRNPVNDARAMTAKLKAMGFEVILRENATKLEMERAIADFGDLLGPDTVGMFFYAGHGLQVNGRNQLVPVDARIVSEQRVRLETVDADIVLEQMAAARNRVNLVILDACRINPFERRFRATGNGLAQMSAPEGTLISYATAPGRVAADGDGANGIFTAELIKAIEEPGLKVEDVFKRVRVAVTQRTNGAQTPWEASSLTGDFFFVSPRQAPQSADATEIAFWNAIATSTNPALYEEYLRQYPSGRFASIAQIKLAEFKDEQARRDAARQRADEGQQRALRDDDARRRAEAEAAAKAQAEAEAKRKAAAEAEAKRIAAEESRKKAAEAEADRKSTRLNSSH